MRASSLPAVRACASSRPAASHDDLEARSGRSEDQWSRALITDPWFYIVAVPAVLLLGLSKSGFLSGFGSLTTPLLALTVPVPQAAAIMLPVLLVMDLFNLREYWSQRDRALLRWLIPAGLAGTVLGTVLFGLLSTAMVSGVVGVLTLLFLAQRLWSKPASSGAPRSRGLGWALGMVSGFTSFVAHAGGPPIAAYVLPLKLTPVVASATMAVFFTAINLSKWLPYAWLGLIDVRNMSTSLALLPLAPIGVLAGAALVRRVKSSFYYRVAYAGMFAAGSKLLYDGVKGSFG
jgi:uncharacterized protein